MGEKIWTCPSCGPVADALYGIDETFHCSGLDCDAVVAILTEAEKVRPKYHFTSRSFEPKGRNGVGKKPKREGKCKWCTETKWLLSKDPPTCVACYHARREERVPSAKKRAATAKKASKVKPKPPAKKLPKPKPPAQKKKRAPKRTPEVEVKKKRRTRRTKKLEDQGLAREVKAIEECANSLDDLSPAEVKRVLSYVVHRYSETHEIDSKVFLNLPGPTR